MPAITASEVARLLAENNPNLIVLDVRREAARLKDGTQLPDATWLNPALWLNWKDTIDRSARVILYCAHGQEISQALTTALCVMGVDAHYLVGGISVWKTEDYPMTRLSPEK